MRIDAAIPRAAIPPKLGGAHADNYSKVWKAVESGAKGDWIPVTLDTPRQAMQLVQAAKRRDYKATQRGNTVYVSKGER